MLYGAKGQGLWGVAVMLYGGRSCFVGSRDLALKERCNCLIYNSFFLEPSKGCRGLVVLCGA